MTANEKIVSDLRVKGYSQRAISKLTGIPKSTVGDICKRLLTKKNEPKAKVLVLDIETAPTLAWVWKRFKENIGQNQVMQEGYVLTWAAKWLGEDTVASDSLHYYPENLMAEDDQPLIASIYEMLEEADIVIAHNGDRFDLPTLNARMVYHGFTPPKPYKTVDTLKILKNKFRFPSNRLDSVCEYLGIGNKVDTGGFSLWARCMNKEAKAFEEMLDYNVYDVVLLEKLYKKIAPWYSTHVNVANYSASSEKACTVCASTNLEKNGTISTNLSVFDAYQCKECGHWNRGRVNLKSKEEMSNTLTNVAGG